MKKRNEILLSIKFILRNASIKKRSFFNVENRRDILHYQKRVRVHG
jgi:hypothetical protein